MYYQFNRTSFLYVYDIKTASGCLNTLFMTMEKINLLKAIKKSFNKKDRLIT